jgi:hypothetical protein
MMSKMMETMKEMSMSLSQKMIGMEIEEMMQMNMKMQ